jgi:hypothetical protein
VSLPRKKEDVDVISIRARMGEYAWTASMHRVNKSTDDFDRHCRFKVQIEGKIHHMSNYNQAWRCHVEHRLRHATDASDHSLSYVHYIKFR